MEWFWMALMAPILFSFSNFIDKFLISKYFKDVGIWGLIILSGLVGFVVSAILFLIKRNIFLPVQMSSILVLSGIIYVLAMIPYLKTLGREDTSLVIPLFQLIPIFSFLFGIIFFNEILKNNQLIGAIIIILGSLLISLEFNSKKLRLKRSLLLLMALSSFTYAIYSLLFKIGTIEIDYWVGSFWFYVGMGVGGLVFLLNKNYRNQFNLLFKKNKKQIIGLNFINESINIVGVILMNLAFTLGPLALVWVVVQTQPLFVFLLGIILTVFFPNLIKEKMHASHLFQKSIAILLIVIGSVVLNIQS